MEFKNIPFETIVASKNYTPKQLLNDIKSLVDYKGDENIRCFAGNKLLYQYQMGNLCKTRIRKGAKEVPSLYDITQDEELYKKLWANMVKFNRTGSIENRLFEANRLNNAIVFFKPTTAKFVYNTLKATKVLDPTAGWGGRLLGAWSAGIDYTGIDTNTNLKPGYTKMIEQLTDYNTKLKKTNSKMDMIYQDCKDIDFATIDYDCVLTSPPYINLEIYENMTPFQSEKAYYEWLTNLINKCLTHIKNKGWVCFNISPKLYKGLISAGFRKCQMEIDLLQQKRFGKDKEDKVYCWNK